VTVAFEVVEDPARACAAMMVSAAVGGGHIVLAGGSTPKAANTEFVHAVKTVGMDLSRTTLWMGDERAVPPDDDRSNYKMIKESLLDPLAHLAQPVMRRMRGELGCDEGAEDYERELRDSGPREFDLVLLGIGPDGHTASMFPGQPSLSERQRLVLGVPQAGLEPFVPRITMTIPALTASQRIIILAAGESKADAIAEAFGRDAEPDSRVPASLLAPEAKLITVLLDRDAASGLDPQEIS
jgi:6-phosphogluconolactonase